MTMYNWNNHILFAVIFNNINFHEYPTRISYQFLRMTETHTLPPVRPHTGTAIVKNSLFSYFWPGDILIDMFV